MNSSDDSEIHEYIQEIDIITVMYFTFANYCSYTKNFKLLSEATSKIVSLF